MCRCTFSCVQSWEFAFEWMVCKAVSADHVLNVILNDEQSAKCISVAYIHLDPKSPNMKTWFAVQAQKGTACNLQLFASKYMILKLCVFANDLHKYVGIICTNNFVHNIHLLPTRAQLQHMQCTDVCKASVQFEHRFSSCQSIMRSALK